MADSEHDDLVKRLTHTLDPADIIRTLWLAAVDRYGNPGGHPEPTLDTLATWLADCPWSIPPDTALFTELAQWDRHHPIGGDSLTYIITHWHRKWLQARNKGHHGHHPLAPVIRRWLSRATQRQPFRPVQKAILPRVHRGSNDLLLPGVFPMDHAPERPHYNLPSLNSGPDHCPSWLLRAYDLSGGISMRQGRGAPWALRLFIGMLLHMPVEDRNGHFHRYRFPIHPDPDWPDVPALAKWLFPGRRGWTNKARDWYKLPQALNVIRRDLAYMPTTLHDGEYLISVLVPTLIPNSPGSNLVEFMARVPGGGAGGARLDWHVLCEYGTEGAVIYRTYLSAMALLDRSAHKGHPITQSIAAPEMDKDGNCRRRRNGSLIRSKTETVLNPATRFVPAMTDADLTRMIGLDPKVRVYRVRARRAFERLDADGHIDLDKTGGKVRIFGPDPRP